MEWIELIKWIQDSEAQTQEQEAFEALALQVEKNEGSIDVLAKYVEKNRQNIILITERDMQISKQERYYSYLDSIFFLLILLGVILQFRRNGRKIKSLEGRIALLEKPAPFAGEKSN